MKNNTTPTEYQECVLLADYLSELVTIGAIEMFTHIPNETFTTSWNAKRKNSLMGVSKGFPDYVIVSKNEAIFIEMKRQKGGTVSVEQKVWLEAFSSLGHKTKVCRGFEEAKIFLGGIL